LSARNRVPEVATVVARFIDFLHQNSLLVNFNRLIISGHSLGAHIAGITGKRVTRGRVQAIYGLVRRTNFYVITVPLLKLLFIVRTLLAHFLTSTHQPKDSHQEMPFTLK
jgi:Lipase